MTDARRLSLWLDQVADDGDHLTPRPPLEGDTEADVVVVGAGLTGLWTAYYLTEADPELRIVLVEREFAGFGASGRNGGWCSALFPASASALARDHGAPAANAMRAAMRDTVVEVGGVAAFEEIDCDFAYGGTLRLARSAAQLERARAEADEAAHWGDDLELLDAAAARSRLAATHVLGGTFTTDCARVQPARLARGLARVVAERGVLIAEGTTALRLSPRAVVTDHGTVRARHVVRATEAWTSQLPGSRRDVIPVYSLMIATEPLPAELWDRIGLARGETFSDHRHLVIYGQRTADDRIAFGGRGAYHRGSRIDPALDHPERVQAHLRRTLVELLPELAETAITHAWGGPLGIARDWQASVGLDARTGLAWAGGYVGDGLATTNLAGRTLADLITGHDSPLTRLPWVDHRSPRWEPEPARWLGVNAGLAAAVAADAEERLTRRPSGLARVLARLTDH
ncbi:NAD(P)/FAD-dependent oxidoreductase [Pengzhenrongella frigida]|uniref:FAD-dependent oxidoreductase n=1 Tax=Pengzhenrongella frigida TaxID=1259133 RepID=A0A4Q5N137_9MICO|nr:FAD-binding oxidoreductase [Cellulomonas sp. HLT2-17]RYV51798.1 FAD-dependent oxidoreductase [Cellulomonas sp. HLT2-17]